MPLDGTIELWALLTTMKIGLDASFSAVPLTLFKPFVHSSRFLADFSINPSFSLVDRCNRGNPFSLFTRSYRGGASTTSHLQRWVIRSVTEGRLLPLTQ
jgi:hypothetical protein